MVPSYSLTGKSPVMIRDPVSITSNDLIRDHSLHFRETNRICLQNTFSKLGGTFVYQSDRVSYIPKLMVLSSFLVMTLWLLKMVSVNSGNHKL